MAGSDPLIKYIVLKLKKKHPGWGAEYVLKKLMEHQVLKATKLPSSMTLWRYWRSFGERLFRQRDPAKSEIQPSEIPHGVWQMDAKEQIALADGSEVSWLALSDEKSGAVIAGEIFFPGTVDEGET